MTLPWCFYHAADLHLDTPFSGLEQVAPDIAEHIREASLESFDALVTHAISDHAAFVLLAGDIYDGAQRGMRAQFRVRDGLQALANAGIRVFMVYGNHDPLDGWSGFRGWPEGVHEFGSSEVGSVTISKDGEPLATIYGISYETARVRENLSRRFARIATPGLHIAVLHCNVEGNSDHEPYAPCTLDDLKYAGMDYWALGHIHLRRVLHERSPWIVYPGNLQGRSPKPSERGEKGAYRVPVRNGVIEAPEFVPLDRVRFVALEVDLTNTEDLAAARARLAEEGTRVAAEHDGRTLLVRATLVGRPEYQADLLRPGTMPDMLRALRDDFESGHPRLWWERIQNETRAPIDRVALALGGDFSAELIREVDRIAASPESFTRAWTHCDSQASQRGVRCPDDERKALLAEAESLAIQLLRDTVNG